MLFFVQWDDPGLYGEEIYRIGFDEAIKKDLLTDYKVLILTLNEGLVKRNHFVCPHFQKKKVYCQGVLSRPHVFFFFPGNYQVQVCSFSYIYCRHNAGKILREHTQIMIK